MNSELLTAWLLTLTLHVSVLLLLAWAVDRAALRAQLGWREWMWRLALFGGVLTASGQLLLDPPNDLRFVMLPNSDESVSVPIVASMPIPSGVRPAREPVAIRAPRMHNPAPRDTKQAALPVTASTDWVAAVGSRLPAWYQLVLAAWLAGVVIALARIAAAVLRLRNVIARTHRLDHARLTRDAIELAAEARILPPQLMVADALACPIAVIGGRIVLPRWVLEHFDFQQLRAMLAHETAHLSRRDPIWKLVTAVACALLWFLPLTAMARRRLDEIAEQSCDAWAARHLGDGRALAECLAECAERRMGGLDLEFAAAMVKRKSPVLQRIDQLIEGIPMNLSVSAPRVFLATAMTLAAAVVLLPSVGVQAAQAQPNPATPALPAAKATAAKPAAVPSLPAVPPAASSAPAVPTPPTPATPPAAPDTPVPPVPPVAPEPPTKEQGDHMHVSTDFNLFGLRFQSTTLEVDMGDHSYSANIKGEINYNENEDGVASLSKGGSASFAESSKGVSRRLDYAQVDGTLVRHYFVNDREQPIDAVAETWIAVIVPVLIRETAADADKRVQRIHAKGGTLAVLDEIDRIDSDYARGEYVKQLVAIATLTPVEVSRVLASIDRMQSDYERRNALAMLGKAAQFDAKQQILIIAQAEKFESDYERSELLLDLLPDLAVEPSVRTAWLHAANGIESDFEHRRSLTGLIEAGGNSDATLAAVIDSATTFESDFERRELLTSAIKVVVNADQVAARYAAAVAGIDSDFERRESLLGLIGARDFGAAGARAVLDSVTRMGSDFESREVLVALAEVMPNDAALIELYRGAARRLSDFERAEAERALDRFAS